MIRGKIILDVIYKKWWIIVSALLIIAIITGGVVFGLRQWDSSDPLEITLPDTSASAMEIHLSGAVANEGIYTFLDNSSLADVLQGAGGINNEADLTGIELYIPGINESSTEQPQKININTAEAWLLEALPNIGPTLAQRIIDYRDANGFFRNIEELTNVSGIGSSTLENISDYITAVD